MKILSKLFPETNTLRSVQVEAKNTETNVSAEDQKITDLFKKHGEALTPEKLEVVKNFIAETEGTLDSKMATIELALDKDIEITKLNLTSIHVAIEFEFQLPLLDQTIDQVYKDLPRDDKAKVREYVKKGMSLENATKLIVQQSLEKLLFPDAKEGVEIQGKDTPEVTTEILNEEAVETYLDMDDEAWIEEVFDALHDSLEEVAEALLPMVDPALFDAPKPVQKILEITMTEEMAKTIETFDVLQKQIVSQLDQILEPTSKVPVKEVLLQAIDKLDHIIMKSDVPLYTDMKTERDLLKSSTSLEQAKVLLDKDIDKAFEIIKEVKSLIDAIKFKPVKHKMIGLAKKIVPEILYDKEMIKSVPIEFEDMKTSPRAVLETLRTMGLNHETEVSEQLNRRQKEMRAPANLKMILMKLEESAQQKVQSKETLDQLTGQQLLNKLEIKSDKQKMMFNVPIKVDGSMKQLKVHVNAKKDNQKIDWQNSRLYFVIHLDKLGDTGVLVDVNKGQVSITIKNDTDNLEDNMSSYVNDAVARLEEIGFTMANIKYEPLTEKEEAQQQSKAFEVSL